MGVIEMFIFVDITILKKVYCICWLNVSLNGHQVLKMEKQVWREGLT